MQQINIGIDRDRLRWRYLGKNYTLTLGCDDYLFSALGVPRVPAVD